MLDRLEGHHRPDDPRQHPEHSRLGAAGDRARRGRGREQAPVAPGPLRGVEHGHLALEAIDRAVDQRLGQEEGRVVAEIPGGKVIGAIDDDVIRSEHIERVARVDVQVVLDNLHVRVDRADRMGGGLDLQPAQVLCAMQDLALQVAGVHDVEIEDADLADARGRQVEGRRRPQAASAEQQDAGIQQLALARAADLRQDQVARVPLHLLGCELRL